ncbi:phosphodiester glycosidase family protein [Rhizobium sp. SL42]|uniref:phosphodiester glycosidase family protein n=1 Tax=Rhizobium sp. SL42 TaxID=2806346 RepID=UPI001F1CE04F|nr:phosphodiester glycosidase family protein [Rhizobium sp. SL42]
MAYLALVVTSGTVLANCGEIDENGSRYTACRFDPDEVSIRTHLADPDGRIYGGFDSLRRQLWAERRVLLFAMNGGMYHDDRSPVGLFVEYGNRRHSAVTGGGWGNFHLLPNGIFALVKGKPMVMETRTYVAQGIKAEFATQSGPMLVIDGAVHPRFLPDSDSLKVRNGIGVDAEGQVHMVISKGPVRFYDFARLFRDRLGCGNALYLDGTISSAFIADSNRRDRLFPVGPIISVSMPLPN